MATEPSPKKARNRSVGRIILVAASPVRPLFALMVKVEITLAS